MNKTTACELFFECWSLDTLSDVDRIGFALRVAEGKSARFTPVSSSHTGVLGPAFRFIKFSADPDISRAFGETQRSCRPAFLIVYVHLGLLVRLSTGCRSCPTAWVPLRIWLPMRESLWVGRPLFCEIRAAPAWLHVALCCPAAESAIFPTSSWLEPRAPLVVFSLRRLIASPKFPHPRSVLPSSRNLFV